MVKSKKKKKKQGNQQGKQGKTVVTTPKVFFLFLPLCFLLNKSPQGLFGEIKIKV